MKDYILAICLIMLSSPLQVLLEKNVGSFWLTGLFATFFVGCITGLGMFQFATALHPKLIRGKGSCVYLLVPGLIVLFTAHYYACGFNWYYSTSTSIAGLALLYVVINYEVLLSFFPRIKKTVAIIPVLIMVAAEWYGLYIYNVG